MPVHHQGGTAAGRCVVLTRSTAPPSYLSSRRRCAAVAAALPTQPPPLASVVPQFPRLGGQPLRDWIGARVENLPGFNADDEARLLLPDVRDLALPDLRDLAGLLGALLDGPTFAIGFILLIAFIYWEGGLLLRKLRAQQAAERRRREREQRAARGEAEPEAGDAAEEEDAAVRDWRWEHHRAQHPEWSQLDWARHERRRGLGWLALTTAALIWLTGVVNGNPRPFQP